MCLCAPEEGWGNTKRQRGTEDEKGVGRHAGLGAQHTESFTPGIIDYPITPDSRNKGL